MATNDGGQAFPQSVSVSGLGDMYPAYPGMSLRDWFAGQALVGLLQASSSPQPGESAYAGFAELAAADAYYFADAMLAERVPIPPTESPQQ